MTAPGYQASVLYTDGRPVRTASEVDDVLPIGWEADEPVDADLGVWLLSIDDHTAFELQMTGWVHVTTDDAEIEMEWPI